MKKFLKGVVITLAVIGIAIMYMDYCQREYEWAVENNIAVDEYRAAPNLKWR